MRRFWLSFAAGGLCVAVVVLGMAASEAQAEAPPEVECATVMGGGQAKWEQQMSKWLAAGKTRFVSNPAGVCAF